MARLPDGDPAPTDGALPGSALATLPDRPLGVYVHVPFCASRCGYCDFNTYVPGEDGAGAAGYADALIAELRLMRRVLGDDAPPASTVFFGGGTPTLLPAEELARILAAIEKITEHGPRTPDMGGKATTAEVGSAIAAALA